MWRQGDTTKVVYFVDYCTIFVRRNCGGFTLVVVVNHNSRVVRGFNQLICRVWF